MAKQTINIGTSDTSGDGESIRNAFDKCNDNFTELYASAGSAFDGAYSSLTGKPTIPADVSDLTDTTNLLDHFSGDYNDLTNTPTIPTVPTLVSAFTNDAGYLTSFTETNDLSAAVTWANVPDANITESSVTQHQAALTITESQISDLSHFDGAYSSLTGTPTIPADVSDLTDTTNLLDHFSGDYNDLTNKPTISSYGDSDVATYLNGNLDSAIIPDTNNTYDLGTAEKKFRDLYLSDSTIHMGEQTISVTGTGILFNGNALEGTLDYDGLTNKPTLVTSYNDLSDRPTIPSTGNFALSNNSITTGNAASSVDIVIQGATAGDPPAFVSKQWSFDVDGSFNFHNPMDFPSLQASITATKVDQWDTAVGWGDHSAAGYLTSYTVTESDVTTHQAALSITESQVSDLGTYVESDTSGITGADQVTNIVTLTQAEYDAIGTPNASTVYIIVG